MLDPRRWHPNVRWLALRIAALPLIFVAVSFASYFMLFGPIGNDDPVQRIAGQGVGREQRQQIERSLNLDEPLVEQYMIWLRNFLRGDLGREFITDVPIEDQLKRRADPTIELLLVSLAIATISGWAIAYVRTCGKPRLQVGVAAICAGIMSVPIFVTIPLSIIVPVWQWNYSYPVGGYASFLDDPLVNFRLIFPPALLIGVATAPILSNSIQVNIFGDGRSRWPRLVGDAVAAWLPAAIAAVVVAELLLSIRGLGSWFFIASYVGDLPVAHLLLTLVTFVCMSLMLFRVERSVEEPSSSAIAYPALLVVGALIAISLMLVALLGPLVSAYDSRALNVDARLEGPSWDHWLGTTRLGQDVLTRAMVALRSELWISIRVLVPAIAGAAILGLAAQRLPATLRSSLLHLTALVRGVPLFWWLIAIIPLHGFSLTAGLVFAAIIIGLVAIDEILERTQDGSLPPAIRDVARSRSASFFLTHAAASIVLLFATLSFVGIPLVEIGEAEFGADLREALYAGDGFPERQYLTWGPFSLLFALLLSLNLMAQGLTPHESSSRRALQIARRSEVP